MRSFPAEKRVYRDSESRRDVVQFTNGPWQNRTTYAALCPFSAEDRYLVFASNRTGSWQLFRGHIASGEICQLTDRQYVQFETFNVAPPGSEVFYQAGVQVWGIDIETGDERLAVDASAIADHRLGGYLTFSPDGLKTVLTYQPRAGGQSALAVAALDGSSIETVHVCDLGTSHARWVPGDPDRVSFSPAPGRQNDPDATPEQRARVMLLDLDSGRTQPLLIPDAGWRYTHEFWSPDGARLYAHRKHVPDWTPASIVSVFKTGGDECVHYTDHALKLGHSDISPDMSLIATDIQEPHNNSLLLLDMKTGKAEQLCTVNASMAPDPGERPPKPLAGDRDAWPAYYRAYGPFGRNALAWDQGGIGHGMHPHPCFSRTGKWVQYASDVSGTRQVYLVRARGRA